MRNHKFRLADMMPNAWFYKLRDMNKTRNQMIPFHAMIKKKQLPNYPTTTQIPPNDPTFKHTSESVTTLYNSTKIIMSTDDSPSSSKKKPKRKTIYRPSPKQDTTTTNFLESPSSEFDSPDRYYSYDHQSFDEMLEYPCSRKIEKAAAEFDMIISEPTLPRILTKPTTKQDKIIDSSHVDTENYFSIQPNKTKTNPATRKSVSRYSRRSLKIKNKKMAETSCGTRKIMSTCKELEKKACNCNCFYSESFAMVKSSLDPEKDFRDSMKEMIAEKNIKASRELEELLACYLSLNSTQYHHLIIKAFEQIWFTMPIST
ncbi:transcription repressor OFP3-like [Henckelia pumila]|uniref:transcription repressor OFP3-like n=1 Tax=Henckelia pumila TaxID=405737 RepID=UPI003C6DBBF0